MSIMAFTKVIASMQRSKVLAAYRVHPGLQQRLGKNYRVSLGLGLHCGWAIEGAVGTEFKIDASYLSPNVSIAYSLEGATQAYGVPLIVAESVVDLCSPDIVKKCRLMDRVHITGCKAPMRLYTIDLDHRSLTVYEPKSTGFLWSARDRFKARQFLEGEKIKLRDDIGIGSLFNADNDIKQMRRAYKNEFIHQFGMGFQNYSEGEWAVARRMLAETQTMLENKLRKPDGPSMALLKFMGSTGFEPPKDWQGWRELPLSIDVHLSG